MHRALVILAWASTGMVVAACSSASSVHPEGHTPKYATVEPAPCWLNKPDCLAGVDEDAYYFVGQSDAPLANPLQPSRDSVHQARRDAELAYARFLGVDLETSTTMSSVFSNEVYRLQFEENIKERVVQTVASLEKVDQYNSAYQSPDSDTPLWSVYVLLKVSQDAVVRHRLAIAEERARIESMPPPPDEWVASLFNIDDSVSVFVNSVKINQCDLSQSCKVKLTPHFKPGTNRVRLEYRNEAIFWTYGYEILRNDEVMYKGRCGQVWVFGCGFLDMSLGKVHEFTFDVEWGDD